MRLRTDSMHLAGWHRAFDLGALPARNAHLAVDPEVLATPPAALGDVWKLRAGYALIQANPYIDLSVIPPRRKRS